MDNKTDLQDVTFLFRLKVDSIERLENILMVIDFISYHFDTNIYVLEAANYNNSIVRKLLPQKVSYHFVEDYDPILHQTKYINKAVENCRTPYLAVWDTDVIIDRGQIITSVEWLRQNEADFVSPYKDKALDTTRIIRELYFKTRDLRILKDNKGKMKELYAPNPVGGGFFANRDKYVQSGIENEYFYGWGRADGERINRWKILGHRYKRVSGPLFHLTHGRGISSKFHSPRQDDIKFSEVLRIYTMSKGELEEEVKTWGDN